MSGLENVVQLKFSLALRSEGRKNNKYMKTIPDIQVQPKQQYACLIQPRHTPRSNDQRPISQLRKAFLVSRGTMNGADVHDHIIPPAEDLWAGYMAASYRTGSHVLALHVAHQRIFAAERSWCFAFCPFADEGTWARPICQSEVGC